MLRMTVRTPGVLLVVLLAFVNVALAASVGETSTPLTEAPCLKCCGKGSTTAALIGHRACNNQTDCHVTNCPQQANCVDYECQEGDTYNDVCRELDEGWNCDSFVYHHCN